MRDKQMQKKAWKCAGKPGEQRLRRTEPNAEKSIPGDTPPTELMVRVHEVETSQGLSVASLNIKLDSNGNKRILNSGIVAVRDIKLQLRLPKNIH